MYVIIGVLILLYISIRLYFAWVYTYFERHKIPVVRKGTFPYGSPDKAAVTKENTAITITRWYKEMKSKGHKFFGMYLLGGALYVPIDLEHIKCLMQKDFNYFTDKGVYFNEKADPLSGHLFLLGGSKWKHLRTKLTPTFTSGKMRMMFDTLVECGKLMEQVMEKNYIHQESIDIKEVLASFSTDVIGSCAFGLDCHSLGNESSPFRYFGRKVFQRTFAQRMKRAFSNNLPQVANLLNLTSVNKEVSNFFINTVKDTVEYREKTNLVRNDFLQMLMEMNKKSSGDSPALTFEEMAAQCFVFFIAGFETSSTTMSYALLEMTRNLEVQEKVRQEIFDVLEKHGGKITYDAINEMKYMHQVVEETLRMYPPVPLIPRQCVKDYKIPGTDIIIPKSTRVIFPAYAVHHDEDLYPNPEVFDPERFTEENKATRHQFAFIPFGEGPRICIGMRFGLMQTKVGLTVLLRKFKFSLHSKTQLPIQFDKSSVTSVAVGGIWLTGEKI